MRLIDADVFYKQFEDGKDGIAMIEALLPSELVDAVIGIYDEIKERLDATPTIDAVHVIRCKDCKHRDPEDKRCDCGHDIMWQLPRGDDWFCADAERRSNETD